MILTRRRKAVFAPAMHGGGRALGKPRYSSGASKSVDDPYGFVAHNASYAIIAHRTQAELCDIRNCDIRTGPQCHFMDPEDILQLLGQRGMTQTALARQIGMEQNKLNKSLNGKRRITAQEMDAIKNALGMAEPIGRSIPVIGQVSAGNWREALQHPIDELPAPDPNIPARAFALRVTGDSMDLLVDDGATIIVDPEDRVLFNDRYYVVLNSEGEATFKQFKADPARLSPCSSNAEHREILLGGETFEVVGRIIWRASRM